MKNAGTYMISVMLSVLLVFAVIGSSAVVIADVCVNSESMKVLTEKNDEVEKVITELDRHYRDKAGETGVPSEVYMKYIGSEYIQNCINACIDELFLAVTHDKAVDISIPKNRGLENSITAFFSDYADSIDYPKDANFNKKLTETIDAAYRTIADYCDIYKAGAMSRHGLVHKVHTIYTHRKLITAAVLIFTAAVLLLLLAVNRDITLLFWYGVSALIAGALGIAPSAYLLATKYFDSFTIKQPQIFTAFTQSLYALTRYFLAASIIAAVFGAMLLVIYAIIRRSRNSIVALEDEEDE